MSADVLPDSRARVARGVVRSAGVNVLPVYCANCGAPHGYVPAEMITHVFALCEPCAEKHGDIAHHYLEPEAAFYERLVNAMNEEKVYSSEEIARRIADEPNGVFAKLKNEWDRMVLQGKVT
jgi:hypothetical protein